ncbi:MAG TPA: DegQ family serine endoprotease [Vicinamibacterales bacterium]|jgi:serine protease Do|nr:DegQ family serine endoprotease [Vicinamibacterales bacterium]
MFTRFWKPGGLAVAGVALTAVLTMKAPDPGVIAAGPPPTTATPAATVAPVSSYAPVVDKVMPAVVTIRVEKRAQMIPTENQIPDEMLRRFFGPQMQMPRQPRGIERGVGSGVLVTSDGYILTNNHVVDGANDVRVELPDRRAFSAKVVGTDAPTDLAVVKVDAKDLPTLAIGDSDAVRVGDVVLAVGNPLNVGETVTSGIISAKGRSTPASGDDYENFLQTDAAINHGNSGGALVNTNGQLIGINSQIMSPSDGNIGIGFAIPSNMAKNVMDQLIKTGSVSRGMLGVKVQAVTPDMATAMNLPSVQGAVVSDVDSGSPAAKAGLQQGDVITQINGKPVADSNELRNIVAGTRPGSTVSLQLLRHGKTENVQATLGELKATRAAGGSSSSDDSGHGQFGMSVQPLTPDIAEQLQLPRSTKGVVVAGVEPDGIAAESGIAEGDVIEKVNGQPVSTVDQLKSALDNNSGKPSLLLVNKKGSEIFLTLKAR